jgi:hydroxyacylglutathione hydrolase
MIILDPGPAIETHLINIVDAVQILRAKVQAIVVTHHHQDHSEGASELARWLAVPVLSFGDPLWAGDEIAVAGLKLAILHTPGHIHAHLGLWWAEQRLLLAGDLVAGQGTILVIPPEGDMTDYLDSLQAMLDLAPAAILPGHGPVITEPQKLLQQYLDHRLRREQQVLAWVTHGYISAADIAARIYADQPAALEIAALQVEAHLTKLRREGRV